MAKPTARAFRLSGLTEFESGKGNYDQRERCRRAEEQELPEDDEDVQPDDNDPENGEDDKEEPEDEEGDD